MFCQSNIGWDRHAWRHATSSLVYYIEISISNEDVANMGKAEILHQIKMAEEHVRVVVKEAEEKRKQLQADGKRRALEKVEAADSDLRKQSDARYGEAKRATDAKKQAVLAEGARKAQALVLRARTNSGKVKALVLSEFERAADA